MRATFGVRKGQKPVARDPRARVSSYMFYDAEIRHASPKAVFEIRGVAVRQTTQAGDLARSFFGAVVRPCA